MPTTKVKNAFYFRVAFEIRRSYIDDILNHPQIRSSNIKIMRRVFSIKHLDVSRSISPNVLSVQQ
jgi:hypothetical protein